MNQTILYLDCSSGISGDMSVAALLDLGADRRVLTDALASLPLSGYSIEIKNVTKSGIRCCDFNVLLEEDNHDHDMQYLHGKDDGCHSHDMTHRQDDGRHSHDMPHTHDDGHHSHDVPHGHTARNLADITAIIQAGALTDGARKTALAIFGILAAAEASVHGKSVEEVHFHEVGAVDSIVDIVAFAVCLDNLAPDRVVVSALTDGTGQIRCQHGVIPVPVPAVAAIAADHGLPLRIADVAGELVTPTGAAIAAAVSSGQKLPSEFRIRKTGFGAGKRSYAAAGFLRAMLLEPTTDEEHDTVLTLETNIDDCSGEALGYTMQLLLDAGALDVFFQPIYMKKNRPAQLLKVICHPEARQTMERIIFHNTTTIGIRVQELQRTKMTRRILAVETPWGMADVKCCTYGNDVFYYPENDSVCTLAGRTGYGFSEMYSLIQGYVREHTML